MGAGGDQRAGAAATAGAPVGLRAGAQQAAGDVGRERALAEARGARDQHRVRHAAGGETLRPARPSRLDPGRVHAPPPCQSRANAASAPDTASATAAAGWVASTTMKRAGSAAARAR